MLSVIVRQGEPSRRVTNPCDDIDIWPPLVLQQITLVVQNEGKENVRSGMELWSEIPAFQVAKWGGRKAIKVQKVNIILSSYSFDLYGITWDLKKHLDVQLAVHASSFSANLLANFELSLEALQHESLRPIHSWVQ